MTGTQLSTTAANYAGSIESILTHSNPATAVVEANKYFDWAYGQLHNLRPVAAAELAAWWLTHPANAQA